LQSSNNFKRRYSETEAEHSSHIHEGVFIQYLETLEEYKNIVNIIDRWLEEDSGENEKDSIAEHCVRCLDQYQPRWSKA